MKTFTNCAEKKAKQFLNLLQGYTKGIRMTVILLLMGVSNAWAANGTITVYFKNTVNWSNVYVYFLTSSYWDQSDGCGSYGYTAKQMTYDNTLKLYKCTYTGNYSQYITFTKDKQDNYGNFWETEAVYRSDFSTTSPVYVPSSTLNETKNNTKYYNDGSWVATTKQTLYYIGTLATPYAYIWNFNNGNHSDWPGEQMTNSGKTYEGNVIYTVTTPYSFKNLIFSSNGNNQTSDLTLEADKIYDHNNNKWITYNYDVTITFNSNGKGNNPASKTVLKGKTITAPTAPSVTGYSVEGWYKEQACTNKWNFGTAVNADMTLFAKWTPAKYTINYKDQNNANFSGSHATGYPTQHTYGTATTLKTASKTGYTFGGWFTTQDCSGSAVTTLGAAAYTANITLYAKWTANKYTVTLSNQGATTAGTASVQATYGSAMPSATMPTKTGYTFGGYYTSNNGGGTQYYNANGASAKNWAIASNSTLYAKWTPVNYTITYNTNGGNSIAQKTYTIETATFDLLNPTKTGHTFAGWYDNENLTGNKVTQVAKGSTGNKTFYAAWTINQYTLTYSAGEGGSVVAKVKGEAIKSPATLEHGTSVTLTATPEGENAFAQWVDGNGNQISTKNPYELTITKNTTLKAQFTSPSRVYLKPFDFWKSDGARIAAYYWGAAGNNWIELSPVDCEGHYYSVDIPAGYSNIIFASLKTSSATGYDNNNKGFNWENSLYQTENLTVQTNGKNMYDSDDRSYIHLEPKAWDDGYARFAAYFYNNTSNEWVNLTKNSVNDKIYTGKIPQGKNYEHVIFCRMNINDQTNNFNVYWHKTKDLALMDNGDNCFWVNTDVDWNSNKKQADGGWYRVLDNNQWKTYSAPTYNVTIKPTIHGTYSVVCNGRTYLAPNKEEIVIPNVPVGTTLTIQDVKQNNETEYSSNIIYKESANAAYQTLEGNQITVCGNTTIDENFVTKNTHVVYLRIPNGLAWGTGNYQKLSVYNKLTESYTPKAMTAAAGNYESGYTYYTYTIPAGTHTIRFEYINGNTKYQTHDFPHVMPLGILNCYTIHSKEGETSLFNGYWSELLSNGDYRLLYVEQVVEKSNVNGNEWKTVVTRKKAHPSDIIKKGVESQIVSLHIYKERKYTANAGGGKTYESSSNPEIILQQYSNGVWVDKESHMVFGPLETLPGMAMAPGRRNAAADGKLVYDDGIEIIKNDQHPDESNGVWNFTVTQSNGGESATIDLTQTRRYNEETDGPYYIRTDVANGNWYNYTNPDNHMTRSDVSKQHSNYSHYFCKWVESTGNVNVKFTIANKYGYAISDTLEADRTDLWGVELTEAQKMLKNQTLPENANVRFTWNEKSNLIHRAYIAGSANVQDRFLVLRGKGDSKLFNAAGEALTEGQEQTPRYGLHANEEIFSDIENWVYQTDVQMTPGAELQVTADYNEKVQYFVGKEGIFNNTILQGSSNEKYLVRLLYDFKTNELISAYVPGASKDVDQISTNLMIIRQNYGEAKQLVFNNGDMSTRENRKAYGVIEFTEDYLKDGSIPYLKRCLYWVSFPFDVNLSEAFGSLVYGKHWLIQEYDGARRAAEGLWKESESFWKLHWEPNITLKAGLGYVIEIDINQMIKDNIINIDDDKQQIAALYFTSNTPITREIINQASYTVNIPAHKCEIVHTGTYGDRTIRDSHWNVIGVPSYINTGATFSDQRYALNNVVKYYYQWDGEKDAYTPKDATNKAYDFQSMYAYMVQYAGDITWKTVLLDVVEPAQIAAKKNSVTNEHAMRLELQQNNILLDKTFVRLQDDVATHAFDFNYDLCKITNKGANIYSIITAEASPVDVAANVLPIEETIIPIGIKTDASGEYTFAMPDGTDGIVVELIDYETNTRTNLLLSDYTITLPKGTNETRFALHLKPSKVVTGLENIGNSVNGLNGETVKKYLIDGVLYLQKGNLLYDAQGRCVK